ncbi:MAG: thiolase domain-containing protein [Halobacteriales archaeon]|nr:thiolase domain-containing protein [Halobacteriales archaeon]
MSEPTIRNKTAIAGAYEHSTREAPDKSTAQIHAEVAKGALRDAGLSVGDVDGYFTAGPPRDVLSTAEYMGLRNLSVVDDTDVGGSSYLFHVGHAASAVAAGKCSVALVTMAGKPRTGSISGNRNPDIRPERPFEDVFGTSTVGKYALAAQRHMYEHGTTREQLAQIRVAASEHAQYNENAMFQEPVTVEEVIESRPISEPLHLLDCCVISDGGGAVVVVDAEIAEKLERDCVPVLGHGEAVRHGDGGRVDLSRTAADESGKRAFEEAGVTPSDVDYASIYDSFTITVLETIEDLGFCEKGKGGDFVESGALRAPDGELPFNTDGGGLCNNHPSNRGGMTKIIEAVRQLRGETAPEVQVPDAEIALAHGTGGGLTRMGCGTLVMGGGNV